MPSTGHGVAWGVMGCPPAVDRLPGWEDGASGGASAHIRDVCGALVQWKCGVESGELARKYCSPVA